jgi:hypothetical protein
MGLSSGCGRIDSGDPLSHRVSMRLVPHTALLLLSMACHHRGGSASQTAVPGLDLLEAATRPFMQLEAAVEAGYAATVPNCLVHEHHGAMGYHHTNPRFMDAVVDVSKPEILLYERLGDEYRLNGVEFIVPYRAWPRDSHPPRALGQVMLQEDNLQFWYLHVWVWRPNPDGLFANFHPQVRCGAEASKVFRPSGG